MDDMAERGGEPSAGECRASIDSSSSPAVARGGLADSGDVAQRVGIVGRDGRVATPVDNPCRRPGSTTYRLHGAAPDGVDIVATPELSHRLTTDPGKSFLRRCCESLLAASEDGRARVVDIEVQSVKGAGARVADLLLTLDASRTRHLVLKDVTEGVVCKDTQGGPDDRAERERVVLELLARVSPIDAAGYLGSVWDGVSGTKWLLFAPPPVVPLGGSRVELEEAARCLARVQASVKPEMAVLPPTVSGLLPRQDVAFLGDGVERALRHLERVDRGLATRGQRLAARLEDLRDELPDLPSTLTHGSFRADNLLTLQDGSSLVLAIDWEKAGIGSPLYDLGYLTDLLDEPQQHALFDTYVGEAVRLDSDVILGATIDLWPTLRFAHLIRAFRRIRNAARQPDHHKTLPDLLARADRCVSDIEAGVRR